MGLEIQKCLIVPTSTFRLIGGSSRKFEGPHFHQGQTVTKNLLALSLLKADVDLVFDFSTPEGNQMLLEALLEGQEEGLKGKRILVGTTGLSQEAIARWRSAASSLGLTVLLAPNTSIGILLTVKAAILAASITSQMGFDIEIIETHHRMKNDAPSGTAKFIAQTLVDHIKGLKMTLNRLGARQSGEIGMHSVRGGSIFGEHEIRIIGDSEEITITHKALSRALFAQGAVVLANWLLRQNPGVYGLLDIDVNELIES